MKQSCSRIVAFLVGVVGLSCSQVALAAESCNQIELAPGSEATVSVLLADVAKDLQPRLTIRNARASGPADSWGTCPTTAPYGACTPVADVATVGTNKIVDPADGMQLIAFRLKNASQATKRDVRLCIRGTWPAE
jgi:hypothetical protein